ncbi:MULTISPECIES: hypothetical protein [Vagococcus]|uniref:Uncharacterized protein n=1 Tax=Vagococcus fluvialis bH819 TaxID=1255619 RepID=A0A1X6WSF9_9ENTE|nr:MULTISPECIES: hypothetical protein [Vagococcus]SLM87218.1 hypothetical protein FM121_14050 [Vagococcus fluvialis bH819]HCM89116.1 hypothetical protein [Vagococcus sp.]
MKQKHSLQAWLSNEKQSTIALVTVAGFIIGDIINDFVIQFIDSFILHTIIGISTIYLTWFAYPYFRKLIKKIKNNPSDKLSN